MEPFLKDINTVMSCSAWKSNSKSATPASKHERIPNVFTIIADVDGFGENTKVKDSSSTACCSKGTWQAGF